MTSPFTGGAGPYGGFDVKLHQIPLLGAFMQNPAEQYKLQTMWQAGDVTSQYREAMAAARLNALGQTMGQMAPVQNALQTMYGANYQAPMAPQNPFGEGHFDLGEGISPPPKDQGVFGGANDWLKEKSKGWVSGKDLIVPGSTATLRMYDAGRRTL